MAISALMHISAGISKRAIHHFRREPNFPFWVLSSCSTGLYTLIGKDGNRHAHDSRSFFLTEPNTPYELISERPLRGLRSVLFIPDENLLPLLNWPQESKGRHILRISNPSLWKQIYHAIGNVAKSFSAIHPRREILAMKALEYVLLLAQPAMESGHHHMPHDQRILKAMEIIRKNPGKSWSIKELAGLVGMSETSLRHRFTKETGVSPIRYAEIQRMEMAKTLLLQSNDSITEIADHLGYANPYHFSNRFRQTTGKSPRVFRRDPTAKSNFP